VPGRETANTNLIVFGVDRTGVDRTEADRTGVDRTRALKP